MTPNNTKPIEQTNTTWWTPRRTKLAGLCGLIGGFGGLAVAWLPIGSTGLGFAPGAVGMLYPVWYVLCAVSLLAATARYRANESRIPTLFSLSLVGFAGFTILLSVGSAVVGRLLIPIGILIGWTYLAMRVLGTLYGIHLWRQTNASRLPAGLFAISVPAIFVFGALNQLGFPDVLTVGATLFPAFIALGYELWSTDENTSTRASGVMG